MWSSTTKVYKTSTNATFSYKESMKYLLEKYEDIAWINAGINGFGLKNDSRGYGWFLIKYSLSFEKQVDTSYMDIKTWPYFTGAVSCGRCFELRNSLGVKLAEASSLWGVVDIKSKRILSPYKVFNINPAAAITDTSKKFVFPKLSEEFRSNSSLKMVDIDVNKHDMIDSNNHVNNTNYVVFLLDPVEESFYITNYIKHIDIHYKKQILYGTKIQSVFEYDSTTKVSNHQIRDSINGDIYCVAKIQWDKR